MSQVWAAVEPVPSLDDGAKQTRFACCVLAKTIVRNPEVGRRNGRKTKFRFSPSLSTPTTPPHPPSLHFTRSLSPKKNCNKLRKRHSASHGVSCAAQLCAHCTLIERLYKRKRTAIKFMEIETYTKRSQRTHSARKIERFDANVVVIVRKLLSIRRVNNHRSSCMYSTETLAAVERVLRNIEDEQRRNSIIQSNAHGKSSSFGAAFQSCESVNVR